MSISALGAAGFWFQKNRRLVCATEYRLVIKQDCWSKDTLFVVYAHNNNRHLSRLGVTVSRRVSPRAVERNRIKRAIRESFRHQQKLLAGLDIVTIARPAAQGIETKQLFGSLEEHWRRAEKKCRSASS